jgi:hypothetical protein
VANRRDTSNDKLTTGLVAAALASGLAATSLGTTATAYATCVGFNGIDIGGGCTTSLGSAALVLGTGTAVAHGLWATAIATGTDTSADSQGAGTLAYAGGSGSDAVARGALSVAAAGLGFEGTFGVGTNVFAQAGHSGGDFFNVAVNVGSANEPGQSAVEAGDGAGNLATNILGNGDSNTAMTVRALGNGNRSINVSGNRNLVEAVGSLNSAINVGNPITIPNGSDNTVIAGTTESPAFLSVAFNVQRLLSEPCSTLCANTVNAGPGPWAVAGAVGVVNRSVSEQGPGVTVATPFNSNGTSNANAFAADGSTANLLRSSPKFSPARPSHLRPATSPSGTVVRTRATVDLGAAPKSRTGTNDDGPKVRSANVGTTTPTRHRDKTGKGNLAGGANGGAADYFDK